MSHPNKAHRAAPHYSQLLGSWVSLLCFFFIAILVNLSHTHNFGWFYKNNPDRSGLIASAGCSGPARRDALAPRIAPYFGIDGKLCTELHYLIRGAFHFRTILLLRILRGVILNPLLRQVSGKKFAAFRGQTRSSWPKLELSATNSSKCLRLRTQYLRKCVNSWPVLLHGSRISSVRHSYRPVYQDGRAWREPSRVRAVAQIDGLAPSRAVLDE